MLQRLTWLVAVLVTVAFGNAAASNATDSYDSRNLRPMAHVQQSIRSGAVKARGTNLGAWLVGEKWMTKEADFWWDIPAQYENGGDYQALKYGNNHDWRITRYVDHHATFIQESDIAAISQAGLNLLRVPVGFWITGADPFDTSGSAAYRMFPTDTLGRLDVLIREWAARQNVAVMISLHAAKGSQNGEEHSAPTDKKQSFWSQYPENVQNTIYVAKFLADRYRNDAAFLGLTLINEPTLTTNEGVLNQYYKDAYKAIRDTGNDCILSIMPLLYKQTPDNLVGFMERPAYTNVWVEWHPYFIWGFENWSAADLVNNGINRDMINKINAWNSRPNANKMFFGEWALASAGQYTNPNSADFLTWTQAQMNVMRKAGAGWTYWSWRLYGDENVFNGWSMRSVFRQNNIKSIVMS